MLSLALLALASPLLPNLVQSPPDQLEVNQTPAGYELRFRTTSANLGNGPLILQSSRESSSKPFTTVQVVRLTSGGAQRKRVSVQVRYQGEPTHGHFHVVGFENFELRDANGSIVLRGHKAGFCLGDAQRAGLPADGPTGRKRFDGLCGKGRPNLLRLVLGMSIGWAEPYPPGVAGQQLSLVGLPAGTYFLVNRVNPRRALRESRYGDNVAATRFELAWPSGDAGPPTVIATKLCLGSIRC